MPYQSVFSGGSFNRPTKANPLVEGFTPGQYAQVNAQIAASHPAPKAVPKAPPLPAPGPTNAWARLAQVGVGMVNKTKSAAITVGKDIAQPVENLGKQIGKQASHLAGPTASAQAPVSIINNQAKAAKVNSQTQALLRQASAQGKIQAEKMVAQGKTPGEVQAYLRSDVQKLNAQYKQGAGTAAELASTVVGGGTAKSVAQGAKAGLKQGAKVLARNTATNAAAGAVGAAGTQEANNPNSSAKDLLKASAEGAAGGAALTVAGAAAGKVIRTVFGKVINRGDATAGQQAAKRVISVTDQSAPKSAIPLNQGRKLLPATTQTRPAGEGFTMSGTADKTKIQTSARLTKINSQLQAVAQGKSYMHPDEVKALAKERADIYGGKTPAVATPKATLKPAAAESVNPKAGEVSTSAKISRPKAPPKEAEPLVNTNKPVKSIVDRFTPKNLKGALNPVDSAARQGHTDFANVARSVAGHKIYALREGNNIASQFDKLYADHLANGGTAQSFIKDIESGRIGNAAQHHWVITHEKTGNAMVESGVAKAKRDTTYVPRVAQFAKGNSGGGTSGLSKTIGASKARLQGSVDEFGNSSDLFKTHAEHQAHVEANGGKVLTDPRDILRHTLPTKMEAIENAKGLARFDKTAMADKRPATVTFSPNEGLPHEFNDYNKNLIPGRAVHPDAVRTIEALTHSYSPGEIGNPIARVNSFTKQLVTLNGLVHGKNFGLASLRKQGAIHTAAALVHANKDLSATFGEDNIKRAITKGGVVPFEQSKQDLFDKIPNPDKMKGNKTWDKIAAPFHNVAEAERNILFNKIGNHLQLSTYFNIEKQMLKKGLAPDEAARVAGQAAKNVSFIASPVETSQQFRTTSKYAFFAGQYFKSTLNEAAKAAGISSDKALSGAAQKAVQKNAVAGLARGFTYLFALAQGINYANTGHSTLQNKDSKISPVIWVDKSTGKQYHATNWFGQIGDILHITNPQEFVNKSSPALQSLARIVANKDYFGNPVRDTSASGVRQAAQIIGNFLENSITPFGIGAGSASQIFGKGGQPGPVTAARLLGYGTSTKDQTPLEKEISKDYLASLPAGTKTNQDLTTLKAQAAQDIRQGKTTSPALASLKAQLSPSQLKTFLKTGAEDPATAQFNKLSDDQKMKILQKYPAKDLKNLDLNTFMTNLAYKKATVQSLNSKGYTDQQIQAIINKTGYNASKLQQLKAEAKKQASIQAKKSARQPKFVSPFIK